MIYPAKRLHEKVLQFFQRARKKYNWFWKEKNDTVQKEELKSGQDAKLYYNYERKNLKKDL